MYAALEFQSFVSNMRNTNIPCIPFYLFKNKVCSIWVPHLFFISGMRNHSMKEKRTLVTIAGIITHVDLCRRNVGDINVDGDPDVSIPDVIHDACNDTLIHRNKL